MTIIITIGSRIAQCYALQLELLRASLAAKAPDLYNKGSINN